MDIRTVARHYASADDLRAWTELSATLIVYGMALAVALSSIGTWWALVPAMIVAAVAGLRIYVIAHDCFHRSFFTRGRVNDIVGVLLSPITMTPHFATRHSHNQHHAHVSDLDHRDTFEIHTMTLREWQQAGPLRRALYRVYRSPVTLILVGPFLVYTLFRRFPRCALRTGLWDVALHNLLLLALLGAVWGVAGWPGVAVYFGIVWLGSLPGSFVTYVVHNFEDIHWGTKPELDFETAALRGSSVLDFGRLFDIALLNIGYHDLHHLNARIPGYKLREAHADLEARGLIRPSRVTLPEAFACLRWKLYDEEADRMVPFPQRERRPAALAAE